MSKSFLLEVGYRYYVYIISELHKQIFGIKINITERLIS